MKKIRLLLLLVCGFASTMYAQPSINQPSNLIACDTNNDGFELFDLTTNSTQILNGLNPLEYSVKFYNTLTNAEMDGAFIGAETNYTNSSSPQTIFVRVHEIADPTNYALASFQLIVNQPPVFTLNDVSVCDGQTVVLNSGLGALPEYLFEWFFADAPIPGATTNQLSVTAAGQYKLVVTNVATGCTFEETAVVTVLPSPVATISGNASIEAGETATVTIAGMPGAVVLYTVDSGSVVTSQQITLNTSGVAQLVLPSFPAYSTVCLIEASFNLCTKGLSDCITIVVNSTDVINFPDANFKAKLLSASASPFDIVARNASGDPIAIDTNANGEIEKSEALLVYWLSVRNSGVADLTGLEFFTNIKDLNCDFSPLTNLNTTGLVNLERLSSYNCSISTANINTSIHLKTIMLDNNQLTSLDVSNLINLKLLQVGGNQLASLDVAGLTNLESLFCHNNQLTTLNVNGLTNLTGLDCANNLLTDLTIDNLINLTTLSFGNPGLNPVAVNSFVNLTGLHFFGGLQTEMAIDNLVNLTILSFSNTSLTQINASNVPNIGEFMLLNNPNLDYLNVKDGTPGSYVSVSGCPALEAICTNEEDITQLYNYAIGQPNNNPNLTVTSYCTFTPGGAYNTITGAIVYDFNNNGCDDDALQPYIKMNINDGTVQGSSFSNETGNYTFYTQDGNFTVTPQVENPSYFTVSPMATTVNFPTVDNSISTNNFCITANGVHPNAEIVVAPLTPARPGFDASYEIVYKNTGNQILSGNVYFYYDDAVLDYVTSDSVPASQATGFLTWNFTNLYPFESRSIFVILNVNAPTETPAVNIGDELIFNVGTNPIDGNEIIFSYSQTVIGSFDPNDITCLQGDIVAPSEIGKYLHYIVNFENTGTAPAENVVVKLEIDPTQYDVSSLQLLKGSHAVEVRVNDNKAEFMFKNINLETNGHGNILLKLKSKSTLSTGDEVLNQANIFFDYNFPIETNEATTLFQALGIDEHHMDASIAIYPNPTRDFVNIKADSAIKAIQVFDVQGRILMTRLSDQTTEKVDLSNYSTGIYYLNITTLKGNKTEKIIIK